MNLHEYQAKSLLNKFGVAVPVGFPAFSVEEATEAAQKLSGSVYVVKAQIHAGGRGKAGGVKVVKSLADVTTAAQAIMGKTLITPQTGPAGRLVRRLYV
jgi:succinyl-CoA synthetase beta subunit